MDLITGQCVEEVQFQVFESFVKEKHSLLGYIRGLVAYSIKQSGFDESVLHTIYPPEQGGLIKIAKTEQDLINFKNRIIIIMEKYQEQSGILDTVLDPIVAPIMRYFQHYLRVKSLSKDSQTLSVPKHMSHLFEVVNYLCKVRGYKTVIKFFPHEVSKFNKI